MLLKWCLKWTSDAFAGPELISLLLSNNTMISSTLNSHEPDPANQHTPCLWLQQLFQVWICDTSQTSKTQLRIFVGTYLSKRSAYLRKETTQRRAFPLTKCLKSHFLSDPTMPEARSILQFVISVNQYILFFPRVELSVTCYENFYTVSNVNYHLRYQSSKTRPILNTKIIKNSN